MTFFETWSDRSEPHYVQEHHGHEEEAAGDAVHYQGRGGVGEQVVRHVGVTSSDFRLNSWQLITDVPRVYYVGEVGWHLRGVVSQDNIGQIVLRSIQTSIQ